VKRTLSLFALSAALAFTAGAQTSGPAFPFTYYIHDTTGSTADTALPAIYQFPSTPLGNGSHIVVKAVNTSTAPAFMGQVFVGTVAGSTVQNPNFSVTGLATSISVPAGGSLLFQVNFIPVSTGTISAYLETTYQVQSGTCSFTSVDPNTQCPGGQATTATLNGVSTQPQLVLSYTSSTGTSTLLQPSSTPLNFGNVSTSSSASITFSLSNQSNVSIAVPAITVPAPISYSSNPFALNVSQVPATLAAGASAGFTITFQPGQTGVVSTAINVGSNTYPIQGAGVVIASIDALQVSYVDSTGVRTLPQAATPISFGQLVAGTGGTASLAFTVTNPSTSYNGVAVSALTLTGASYTLSALTGATTFPATILPGASITFTLTFTPTATGTFTGSLAIGTRVFSLTGLAVTSPLPSLSLTVTPLPLTSQQQASATLQLASAAVLTVTGTITMAFTPSVSGVTKDPAIVFLTNNSLQLPITATAGSQTITYTDSTGKAQSVISFQTGTTAGTLTFTVSFPNTPAFTQSFTITPAKIQFTSATAAVQSSQVVVVTVNGYDNTYSAGTLNFTFYYTSGTAFPAISYNAAGAFQANFLGSGNTTGGAFVMQATFPVTGSVTTIGSVAVSISNSAGQTSQTLSVTQ
jgi:hypothetical protein